MLKFAATVSLATTLIASPALAGNDWMRTVKISGGMVKTASGPMPSDGYSGRHWTHPAGCQYSRTGRPGEVVWYLLVNTIRKGCPTYIVQKGFDDIY